MELNQLIDRLAAPSAYPAPVQCVEVRQTHISVVFLADDYVYKVKKPVNYGFVDFSTLEKRRFYCDEEVRLNRRLAPDVYLGVVPITSSGLQVQVDGAGDIVEWAVKMRRLPDDSTLQYLLRHGTISEDVIKHLASKIAVFHAQAESGAHIARYGEFAVVAGNARENFEQSVEYVGTTVSQPVFERSQRLTEAALAGLHALIERRRERNVPRDTHGDLRLEHIYYFPSREPPYDLLAIDCIEFNERFRFADPVSDMAFLFMGLAYQGRRDLAQALAQEYFSISKDDEGRELLPFYVSYRAAIRGKVEGLKLSRPEIAESDRAVALSKARGSWLLALSELEERSRKPCLILIGGLPGTGKSTLARSLAQHDEFRVIRSDVIRKELAGAGREESSTEFGSGIYTAEWTMRTYVECLRRAEELLFMGERVLVDANFREERQRRMFLEAALRWGVAGLFLNCEATPELVFTRLAHRSSDASDANWLIYQQAAQTWEDAGPETSMRMQRINTDGSLEQVLRNVRSALQAHGLLNCEDM